MELDEFRKFEQTEHIRNSTQALRAGICYSLCEFMDTHPLSPWRDIRSLSAAWRAVMSMSFVPMTNFARSREFSASLSANAGNQVPDSQYGVYDPDKSSTLYRARMIFPGFGAAANQFGAHEAILLTGVNEGIVFDPNFGFQRFKKSQTEDYRNCFWKIVDDWYFMDVITNVTFRKSWAMKIH